MLKVKCFVTTTPDGSLKCTAPGPVQQTDLAPGAILSLAGVCLAVLAIASLLNHRHATTRTAGVVVPGDVTATLSDLEIQKIAAYTVGRDSQSSLLIYVVVAKCLSADRRRRKRRPLRGAGSTKTLMPERAQPQTEIRSCDSAEYFDPMGGPFCRA